MKSPASFGKITLASFFCLLFGLFLNTLCYAQPSGQNKLFLKPIILADYDKGSLDTNSAGISGGDETKPGTVFAAASSDYLFARGQAGYSAHIDYDVAGWGEYSFYWIKLAPELPDRPGSTGVLDLRGYNYLSFWVKSMEEGGNIKVELHQDADADGKFDFGRDITSYVYANNYIVTGAMNSDWQKVFIPLKDFARITDWSKALEMVLVFENKKGFRQGVVCVDDIVFGYRPDDVINGLSLQAKEINAPQESSFKANGLKAKQCLTLNGSNTLEIKAESVNDNPRIESVRFEYSADQGQSWVTIGSDYDVSKNIYSVTWKGDNTRGLLTYKIRAIATDIEGSEKATGTLLECAMKPMTDEEFLDMVERKAFDFFAEHQSRKTGLFSDTSGGGDASIASTGFGLAALCIGAERKWIDKDAARKRAELALDTFLPKSPGQEPLAESKYGFFYHFLDMNTASRAGKSEISTVDTALLVCGALTAGEYFGGDVKKKAEALYAQVEWDKFLCAEEGPWLNMFSMGWSPERGFLGSYWDYYTDEVVIISLLAIGSPTHPVDPAAFYAWTRNKGSYENGESFIYTWHGSLFSYQYAGIWFDFRGLLDKEGTDWFKNSADATLANRQFCIDNADKFKGYGPNSWGITSMARPEGYTMHFGTPPMGSGEPQYDGTVSAAGPAGSIVYTPFHSLQALRHMYAAHPRLWGQYGFKDSFNLDMNWYAPGYYGIDAALFLIPVDNFRNGIVWKYFMNNAYIKEALKKAGFVQAKNQKR